jgi:hypothetical protein
VPRERQAEALDGVRDEHRRPVTARGLERLENARQVVAAEVRHQARELVVRAALDQARHGALVAEVVEEPLSPGGPALEGERRVELVRRGVDPLAQALAAGLAERLLHQRAVLEDHHVPAEGLEQGLEAGVEALADDRVEALAVVVDDPPAVPQSLLPALEQRLEDVALVHLGVAHEGDHAPFRPLTAPAVRPHVVLHEAGEQRLGDAEADGARREVHVVHVLGARGIRLRALEAPEVLELVAGLVAQEVLDGVEDRARVRLHRHPVLGAEHREVERRHDGRERGRGGLVPADLQPVAARPQVVRVVDGPGRQPAHLALELGEVGQAGIVAHRASGSRA